MWKTAIKLAMLYMLRNRLTEAKTRLKGDLYKIKDSFADLTESRVAIFKNNFNDELERVIHSMLALLLMFIAIMCSTITAIIWLAAIALNSPHRDLIFSITIILPLILSLVIFLVIRHSWTNESLFHKSIVQIQKDWQAFREVGEADTKIEPG